MFGFYDPKHLFDLERSLFSCAPYSKKHVSVNIITECNGPFTLSGHIAVVCFRSDSAAIGKCPALAHMLLQATNSALTAEILLENQRMFVQYGSHETAPSLRER